MAVQIQLRRGLSSQWNSSNPILAQGEPGLELDTGRIKIGNSASTWTQLSYSTTLGADYLSLIAASANFLTKADAAQLYIPITASGPYLTELEASDIYIPITASSNIVENYIPISSSYAYLTRTDAENTYIPISSSADYLTESEAQGIYVPISSSANIVENYIPVSSSYVYLTRSDAENTYIPISSSAEYLTESEAAGIYVPITASSNIRTGLLEQSEAANVYAPLYSASLTGVPVAPTATAGTSTKQIATTEFVRTEITNLVDSAPGTLDTLNELAAALGDDSNFATSTASAIGERLTIANASAIYLSMSDAQLQYIPITASGEYLTESEAEGLYVPISASSNIVENYIPVSSSYVYLTRSDAESTYIPITASAEYLTESEAADLYIPISASSEYLTESEALGIYVPISASSAFLNAETLDGQDGSFYLDWFNITSKPNVTIGIELTGSTNGSGSVTLSQLNNGQVSISTNTGFAQSASSINWSGITDAPDPIIGLSLSGNTVGAASVTLNNLTNGQIELVTRTEFAETASSIAISGVVGLQHELNSSASAIGQRLTIENASATYRPINAAVDADTLDGYDSSFFINSSSAVQEKDGNFTFHGTLTVNDLVISGSALTLSTTNLAINDSLVQLAHEQYNTDSVDIGIIGSYGDGTTSSAGHYHTSFARDASQGKWKLLENGPAPVNNVIDYSHPSVEYGVLQLGAIEVSSSVTVTNFNADLLDGFHSEHFESVGSASAKYLNISSAASAYIRVTSSAAIVQDYLRKDAASATYAANLSELNDVNVSSAAAGEYLKYNGSQWISASVATGGGTELIEFNQQTASAYTLVSSDAGKLLEFRNSSSVTVPSNFSVAFSIGTKIDILQTGDGQVNVLPAAGGIQSWTTQTSNFGTYSINDIAYGNGIWVAVGGSSFAGRIRRSTDAVTWTTVTTPYGYSFMDSIDYGNNLWIAVGRYDGSIKISTNSTNWSDGQYFNYKPRSIAYGNGTWVIGTRGSYSNQSPEIYTSTDSVNWTTQTSNFTGQYSTINSISYGNGTWVAVGYSLGGGQIRTSTNLVTWTPRTSNVFSATHANSVFYGNGTWVVGFDWGEIRTSTDAITWTTRTSNLNNINSVYYANGVWVAGGYFGTLRYSTDAITWTTQTSNFGSTTIRSVVYGNNLWIAGGDNGQLRTAQYFNPVTLNSKENNTKLTGQWSAASLIKRGTNEWTLIGDLSA